MNGGKTKRKPLVEQRVSTFLKKPEIDFLDEISWQVKAGGGYKLPRTKVIRALIAAAMSAMPDLSGVRSEAELKSRLSQTLKNSRRLLK